jgi:hypothetical protein
MKKFQALMSLALSLLMMLSLASCAGSQASSKGQGSAAGTASQAGSAQASSSADAGKAGPASQLYAAASRQKLTLPDSFFPYEGFRRRNFSEQDDDLYVRAIALKNDETTVLYMALELGDVGGQPLADWTEAVADAAKLSPDQIYICADHVHSAPYAGSDYEEKVGDAEKTAQFEQSCQSACVSAAKECMAKLQPAVMKYGESQCYVNVNRDYKYTGDSKDGIVSAYATWRNYEGYSDHTVSVFEFDDLSGNPIAFWTNYAVHSEVMFHAFGFKDNNMILCSDLAGHSSAYIEERYPNTVCMYTMGAAADQMPLYIAEGYTVDASGDLTVSYLSPQGALGVLDAQAEQLGEAIIAAIRGMDPASAVSKVSLRTLRSTVTVDGKVKDEDRSDTYKGPTTIPTSQAGYAYDLKADPVDIKIGVIQLGQYAIASVGCEITAQIGTDIQNALQALGYADTVLVSQCNGSKQYLTTDEGYAAFTFEATASHMAPGSAAKVEKGFSDLAAQ